MGGIMANQASGQGYQKVADHPIFTKEVISEYQLPNGFRVLLLPRHQSKLLTYQTWFSAGSLAEKADKKLKKTGLAHLFEHMMFRGTEKYPDGQFDQKTSELGAHRQNATTYFYRTNYYEDIPSAQLEKLMELESDRMAHLKLDRELLEREKGAVVGELRRLLDSPLRMGYDALLALTFERALFRYTVIGTEAEIKGFSLEEGQYFYKTYYAPNDATLIIVGDTTESELLPFVMKYYGTMQRQTVPEIELPEEPVQKKARVAQITHPQATSDILLLAYPGPAVTDSDYIALSVLANHLSSGMEARFRKLLVDKGIAVSTSVEVQSRPNLFQVHVDLAESHSASEALKIVEKELRALTQKPIPRADFSRAVNQQKLDVYSNVNSNHAVGELLGEYLTLCGNYMRGFEVIEGYSKVSPKDVLAAAKKYLVPARKNVVFVLPGQRPEKAKKLSTKAKKK